MNHPETFEEAIDDELELRSEHRMKICPGPDLCPLCIAEAAERDALVEMGLEEAIDFGFDNIGNK